MGREEPAQTWYDACLLPDALRGSADTVRSQVDLDADAGDLAELAETGDFRRFDDGVGWSKDGKTSYPRPLRFVRHDGLKVVVGRSERRWVAIEFSVPRVLGLASHRLHEVTPERFISVVRDLPRQLLPVTFARADALGIPWGLTRFDGALDMICDVQLAMRHMRLGRLPHRCRRGPRFELWNLSHRANRKASGWMVSAYEKARDLERRGIFSCPEVGQFLRVEHRFSVMRGMSILAREIGARSDPALCLPLRIGRGKTVPCALADFSAVHAFLRREMAALDGGPLDAPRRRHARRQEIIERFIASPPRLPWRLGLGRSSTNRLLRDAHCEARRRSGFSLMHHCYPEEK